MGRPAHRSLADLAEPPELAVLAVPPAALEAAVDDARESAEALADAADLTLGRVTAVVEGSDAPSPLAMAARAADEAAASTPIEAGEHEISATVTVTFAAS